eukprot:CAMPEP_0184865264 /NCGR_PEP_ID=MMETSP0580-20130426/17466_1 /TAXON_ID=1118495 /ORGANISM="Dactyliosolen fragilissimus" /LENGTH=461 /DNA_ID=CAMNT_0027364381 /DNA_START=43 /DNA_END=1428 /DNA_ORIENTATION=+
MSSAVEIKDLVEFTYGKNANLYEDVFRISRDASQRELQAAFFDRRYEIYENLQNASVITEDEDANNISSASGSSRHFNEKKMDVVISAFRILSDPSKRRQYDATLDASYSATPAAVNTSSSSSSSKSTKKKISSITKKKKKKSSGVRSPVNTSYDSSFKSDKSMGDLDRSRPEDERQEDNNSFRLDVSHHSLKGGDDATVSTLGMGGAETPKSILRKGLKKNKQQGQVNSSDDENNRSTMSKKKSPKIRSNQRSKKSSKISIISTPTPDSRNVSTNIDDLDDTSVYSNTSIDSDVIASRIAQAKKNRMKEPMSIREDENEDEDEIRSIESSSYDIKDIKNNTLEMTIDLEDEKYADAMARSRSCLGVSPKSKEFDDEEIDSGCVQVLQRKGMTKEASLFQNVREEITGSIADTMMAVDQVLSAFVIGDGDIDAVAGSMQTADEWFFDDDEYHPEGSFFEDD